DFIAVDVLGALPEVVEPGRTGLRIMTLWTWSIAYRRFQQGILIRYEHSHAVTFGTFIRLVANATVLLVGWRSGAYSGVAVATAGLTTGVVVEALYAAWRVRPVLTSQVRPAPTVDEPLNLGKFLRFYTPLALVPLVTLVVQPVAAGAMNRMPDALPSVASWPAVWGLVFITRSVGFAYNEVVVTLIDEPGSVPALRRFHRVLAVTTVLILVMLSVTPLAALWFERVSGLAPELAELSRVAVGFAILMPGYQVLQSWYQGALVKSGYTRPVTIAVALYCIVSVSLLSLGTVWQPMPGLHYAMLAFVVAGITQTAWLAVSARGAIAEFARTQPTSS
ncbi:MAG: hypothetical protein GY711_06165, partial [bacterium]|nr:hypothetical protein [bacterium]